MKNVTIRLTNGGSGGVSRFRFLILSCRFELGSHDWDCSPRVHFLGEGVGGRCHKRPTYKLPIIGNISFSGAKPKKTYWLD
jgi:hypothetical protein